MDKCYARTDELTTWSDANAFCLAQGAILAEVCDADLNNQLTQIAEVAGYYLI